MYPAINATAHNRTAIAVKVIGSVGAVPKSSDAISFAVPLAVLAGGAVSRLRNGPVLAGVIGVQAAVAIVLMYMFRFQGQLPVVLGQVSAEEYQ